MNTLDPILVVDVNVIIHLEKAGLLDELINDKKIRIVDLVLYEEYEYKRNLMSDKVEKIEQITLSEEEVNEAHQLYLKHPRNSVFDYYSYIAARNNGFDLLTGDWKLKKYVKDSVVVHGAIWYVQQLNKKQIISDQKLKEAYEIWLNDQTVFIPDDILSDLIIEMNTN